LKQASLICTIINTLTFYYTLNFHTYCNRTSNLGLQDLTYTMPSQLVQCNNTYCQHASPWMISSRSIKRFAFEYFGDGKNIFRVLVVFTFNYITRCLSCFSSLGAGSDERTQTPLGAHQKRIWFANKGEHGCCDLQPNYVSCIGNSTSIRSLLHQCIISSFASFHSYHHFY
jgi:hypothetical protein